MKNLILKKLICALLMLCLPAACALAQMPVAEDSPVESPVAGAWKLAIVFSPDMTEMAAPAQAEMDMQLDFAYSGKVSLTMGEKVNTAEWEKALAPEMYELFAEFGVENTDSYTVRYGDEEIALSLVNGRLYWGMEDMLLMFTPDGSFAPGMQPDPAIAEFFGYWECTSISMAGVPMDPAAEEYAGFAAMFRPMTIEDDEPALCKIGRSEYDDTTFEGGLLCFAVGDDDILAVLSLMEDGSIQVDLPALLISARYEAAEMPTPEPTEEPTAEPTDEPVEESAEATAEPVEAA